VALDVVVGDLGGGVVREHGQTSLDPSDIVGRVVDEKVDVLREAPGAVGDDGEPADQQVSGSGLVQRPADSDDVVGLRRS
jgi:hypothetical protein